MIDLWTFLPLHHWVFALLIALLAGLIKGVVGFAMPLVLVSGLGSFMPPEYALAGLIMPTVFTNLQQALRHGASSAIKSVARFRWFMGVGAIFLILGAMFVPLVPAYVYLLVLGVPIVLFAASQLLGWRPKQVVQSRKIDIWLGVIAGFFGGIAGIWGPPTVSYLTALNTPKQVQVQVQGVIYLLGAIMLFFAHLMSGILTGTTLMFSLVLVVPAMIGMLIGTRLQDLFDQEQFRRATLFVLLIAGANLVRRGMTL